MQQRDEALLERMRNMSAGDLSILEAALTDLDGGEPVMMTTTPGSDNDLLWSQMVAHGWLTQAAPLEVPIPTEAFVVSPAAAQAGGPIRDLLAYFRQSDAITKLINELRTEVPPWLTDAVRTAIGTPADLAMMLGAIVESTMRRAIKPELHDAFLSEASKMAERMRSI